MNKLSIHQISDGSFYGTETREIAHGIMNCSSQPSPQPRCSMWSAASLSRCFVVIILVRTPAHAVADAITQYC